MLLKNVAEVPRKKKQRAILSAAHQGHSRSGSLFNLLGFSQVGHAYLISKQYLSSWDFHHPGPWSWKKKNKLFCTPSFATKIVLKIFHCLYKLLKFAETGMTNWRKKNPEKASKTFCPERTCLRIASSDGSWCCRMLVLCWQQFRRERKITASRWWRCCLSCASASWLLQKSCT